MHSHPRPRRLNAFGWPSYAFALTCIAIASWTVATITMVVNP